MHFGDYGWPHWEQVPARITRSALRDAQNICDSIPAGDVDHFCAWNQVNLLRAILHHGPGWEPDEGWFAAAVWNMALRGWATGESRVLDAIR